MTTKTGPLLACLLAALSAASCDRRPAVSDPARGQVMKDDQGRTVSLDPVTGRVTAVDPPAATPAEPRAASPEVPSSPAPVGPAEAPPSITPPEAITVQPARAPNASACVPSGNVPPRDLFAPASVNAYIRPGRLQAPVAMLPAGTRVRAVSAEGDWFLVRFDIGSGGERRAYVHCSEVAIVPSP